MPKYNEFELDIQFVENTIDHDTNFAKDIGSWHCTDIRYFDCIDPPPQD